MPQHRECEILTISSVIFPSGVGFAKNAAPPSRSVVWIYFLISLELIDLKDGVANVLVT